MFDRRLFNIAPGESKVIDVIRLGFFLLDWKYERDVHFWRIKPTDGGLKIVYKPEQFAKNERNLQRHSGQIKGFFDNSEREYIMQDERTGYENEIKNEIEASSDCEMK